MISAHDIKRHQTRSPFHPFRLHLTDGRSFEVQHPEMILVLRNRVDVALIDSPKTDIPDRVEELSILHIVSVEPIQAPRTKRSR